MNEADYYNKVHGGWLGRVAGSHFGAPLEFRPTWYTMRRYGKGIGGGKKEISHYVRPVDPAAVNDDEIYQIIGLIALEKYGADLTTMDIGEEWRQRLYRQQFTAEKVAFENLKKGIAAPACASPENGNFWFDAIGAQMKADLWGLVTPCCPELAADYARIDGAVAHQGMGIDGEIFIAAIVAGAFGESDMVVLIQNALALLPPESVYCRFVERTMEIYRGYPGQDQWWAAYRTMMQEWHQVRRRLFWETNDIRRKLYLGVLHPVHVLPNAGIITLSLLYARHHVDPFGRALCLAGMMGLDTDCNCGNIGTIMGTILGADRIPQKWIAPLQDTFHTFVREYEHWKISELARRICAAGQKVMQAKRPGKSIV